MILPELPSVELSNGLVVANYSSPHSFKFTDESILEACSNERALLTMLKPNEQVVSEILTVKPKKTVKYINIKLCWEFSWFVEKDVLNIMETWVTDKLEWDLVLVPLPFMFAWKWYRDKSEFGMVRGPFRAIRMADRINKKVHIDKFCV